MENRGVQMKTRSIVALRVLLAASMVMMPITAAVAREGQQNNASAQARGERGSLTVPVSGVVRPEANPTISSALAGTFTITRFVRSGDDVVAVGTLLASFIDPATNAARTIVTAASFTVDRQASGGEAVAAVAIPEADDVPVRGPAVAAQPACDILNLVLGPLDLNLLGLRIQLNQVELDITAVPGAGNLLGNLLCAIAGLLDPPGPLAQLVALLNQLLGLLG
jgi:hypothetical protein